MGIPKFRKALLEYFQGANIEVSNKDIKSCDCLYVDVNSIIHTAIQVKPNGLSREEMIKDYKECCDQVIKCLVTLIEHYKPTNTLYLAVDGVPPMAKIKQQKERRYASAMTMKENGYDSNLVSPGTDFMFELDVAIKLALVQNKNDYDLNKVVYSSHLVPGEGEHKIMEYIRKNEQVDGVSVIYGNDSDLIILGLALGLDQVFVCGDTVQLYTLNNVPIKTMTRNPISIDNLRVALTNEIGEDKEEDFVFTMSLLGNDFLPRSPIMSDIVEGFELLMKLLSKKQCSSYLTMKSLVSKLSENEDLTTNKPCSLYSLREKYRQKELDRNTDTVKYPSAIFDTMAENSEKVNSIQMFKQLWYTKCFNGNSFTEEMSPVVLDMCVEYLRGLHWVKSYYTLGHDKVTWLWLYPYNHAPLFEDLLSVLLNYKQINGFVRSCTGLSPAEGERKLTTLHHIVSVMPIQSYKYIPDDLYKFYSIEAGLLHIMPSGTVTVDYEFTELEHQKRVILPLPNYYEIMSCFSNTKMRKSLLTKHSESREITNSSPMLYADKIKKELNKRRDEKQSSRGGRGGSFRGKQEGSFRGREGSFRGGSFRGKQEGSFRGGSFRGSAVRGKQEGTYRGRGRGSYKDKKDEPREKEESKSKERELLY